MKLKRLKFFQIAKIFRQKWAQQSVEPEKVRLCYPKTLSFKDVAKNPYF